MPEFIFRLLRTICYKKIVLSRACGGLSCDDALWEYCKAGYLDRWDEVDRTHPKVIEYAERVDDLDLHVEEVPRWKRYVVVDYDRGEILEEANL